MAKKTNTSEFRYATSDGVIPWDAVGEKISPEDVTKLVEFLLPKGAGTKMAYQGRVQKVRKYSPNGRVCRSSSAATWRRTSSAGSRAMQSKSP